MPVLKNARQEAFCQALARGMTQVAAYEAAGYRPDKGNASELTAKDNIQARVKELQEAAAQRAIRASGKTKTDIIAQLDDAIDLSKEIAQPASIVTASMGQAKILGYVTERHIHGIGRMEEMTADELKAFLGVSDEDALKLLEAPEDAGRPN